MPRLVVLALTMLSGLALAAPSRQTTTGGGCCTLIFVGLFVSIYRAGGTDWLRSIGAAIVPGLFGWFIWLDRGLGAGARWTAVIFASLQAGFFLLGVGFALMAPALLSQLNPVADVVPSSAPIDLSNVPEDPSLGLHPLASINSDPAGAKVFVNGEARGKTPLDTPLTAGERNEVKLELAGYFPAERSGSPNARERLRFDFTLKSAARLELTSEPPGARVLVAMKEVLARTPGHAGPLEPGETELIVLLPGYQAQHQLMELPVGDTRLHVVLEKGVQLTVTSTPEKADVRVDGVWQGLTPTDVFVSPQGKHVVEVKKESWSAVKKTLSSMKKATAFHANLVDVERVGAMQAVAKARARYDKVNLALEKVQSKVEQLPVVPAKLEKQRLALERDMEKATIALEQADAALKTIEEARGPAEPKPEEDDR